MFYFSKKVRLFSQNDVLFLFYFLINPTMTTDIGFHVICYLFLLPDKYKRGISGTSGLSVHKALALNRSRLWSSP